MTQRTAVIGIGRMGRNHARVYAELPDVELAAVADMDQAAVEAASQRFGCEGFTDYRTMLDTIKPDAISLAVPTEEHLRVAEEVARRGIHILVEKPIASTVPEGQQMISLAREQGIRLMIGHIERFNPAIQLLKKLIAEGEAGRLFQLDAFRQGPFPGRIQDVGVTLDLAVHDLDVIRYVSGSEIVRAYAETGQRIHSSHEDQLSGLLRLSDGSAASLNINWLTPTKIRQLRVVGERGMFKADYLTQDLYFYENARVDQTYWEPLQVLRGVAEGRMIRHVVAKKEPLRLELEAFLKAVQSGSDEMPVTPQDGLRALELAQALVRSGKENRALDV